MEEKAGVRSGLVKSRSVFTPELTNVVSSNGSDF